MMKRFVGLLFLSFCILLGISVCADDVYDVSIELQIGQPNAMVNGTAVKIDENESVVPFVQDGRTLVPLRFLAESLKLDVEWEEEAQTIVLKKADMCITVTIGEYIAYINGSRYPLECSPMLQDARTFVPVRFVAEALRCEVSWVEESQTVLIKHEIETELDVNDTQVQALFADVLNNDEFASYYAGYCDAAVLDSPENMFSGTMRELFSVLKLKKLDEKTYTQQEAESVILEFLSHGDISDSLSSFGIDNLQAGLENGGNYGSDSTEEKLIALYDGTALDAVSVDLFGSVLPKHRNLAYSVGYHWFHLFNRVNLFYPLPDVCRAAIYYNANSHQYLFTELLDYNPPEDYKLDSETKLLRATAHNSKVSLYIYRKAVYDEYSGGQSVYEGVYKNTYQKGEDGYYWVSSFGDENLM